MLTTHHHYPSYQTLHWVMQLITAIPAEGAKPITTLALKTDAVRD